MQWSGMTYVFVLTTTFIELWRKQQQEDIRRKAATWLVHQRQSDKRDPRLFITCHAMKTMMVFIKYQLTSAPVLLSSILSA